MTSSLTVSNIIGPWSGTAPTGLIQRCRDAWDIPISELSDHMVATFLDQCIAIPQMLIEAERRLSSENLDDTEYFDGQLQEAFNRARGI